MTKKEMLDYAEWHESVALSAVVALETARAAAHFIVAKSLREMAQRTLTGEK